ncbi:MAG: hypothetical protein AAF191_15320, partial [Verrucomicrobiota bacterium]
FPAASHSQLSLIGWGSNQVWDQSALGSWGESICFEPGQAQGRATITDVRPLLVRSIGIPREYHWTANVGGGDFFRFHDLAGTRIPHSGMRADYRRVGPCLTEVTYAGTIGETGIQHQETVSLGRTDDLVTGTYRIRMEVSKLVSFSRFVLFQIGADSYSTTREKKLAVGQGEDLIMEWDARWGGDEDKGEALECRTLPAWASLHETLGNPHRPTEGAWANKGFIIREWRAKLGGQEALPWMQERGLGKEGKKQTSSLNLVPPPSVKQLLPGDFVEATIEHVVIPQFAKDYYGPNASLRQALQNHENTWRMMSRQAVGDQIKVRMRKGSLRWNYPDVRVVVSEEEVELTLEGGLGLVPVTIEGLSSHQGYVLRLNEGKVDQAVHGKDYWQTEFDPLNGTWSQTYNVPIPEGESVRLRFGRR